MVFVPVTLVNPVYASISSCKGHSSNPVPLALFPEALVFVPSSINHSTNSLTLSFLEIAYEEVAVSMLQSTPAMLEIILKVTIVQGSIWKKELSKAMLPAILEHTDVVPLVLDKPSHTIRLVILKPALIKVAIRHDLYSLTMLYLLVNLPEIHLICELRSNYPLQILHTKRCKMIVKVKQRQLFQLLLDAWRKVFKDRWKLLL